jgi:hypothetical protein
MQFLDRDGFPIVTLWEILEGQFATAVSQHYVREFFHSRNIRYDLRGYSGHSDRLVVPNFVLQSGL